MNFNEYDKTVNDWVTQVLSSRTVKTDVTKKYCKDIIRLGKNTSDSKLLGFAYYYLAESYFYENDYNQFVKYLILGLKHQQASSMGNLLARSYNMLGANADNHGNLQASLDYYLTSLKYSQKDKLYYEEGLANTNIGKLYTTLLDYKTAINYFKKALNCFKKAYSALKKGTNNSYHMDHIILVETSLGTCYFQIGDMESALRYFYKIEKEQKNDLGRSNYQMSVFIFEIIFYNKLEKVEKRDELIKKMLLLLNETSYLLDNYDEVLTFCEILLEVKQYKELWEILQKTEELVKQSGSTYMKLRVLRFKLQYYRTRHDEAGYLNSSADYFQLSELLESENITMARESIKLRMNLEHFKAKQTLIQEENKILTEKSERDALTQLPNRNKLNDYSEIAFDRAFKTGKSLALEIFDIDCFKQYNDTYGHPAGDECLTKIAQLLHNLMEDGLFCARYGGDEFMIIYEDKTDEEITKIARKLQADVIALNLENKNSIVNPVVTISQGIRNSIPKKENKFWDYLFAADTALYQVKRANKNDICIVHRMVVHDDTEDSKKVQS